MITLVYTFPAKTNELVWRSALITSAITYLYSNPFESDFLGFETGYHTDRDMINLKLLSSWGEKKELIQTKYYQLNTHYKLNLNHWHLGLFSDQGKHYSRYQRTNNLIELMINFRHLFAKVPQWFIETNSGVTYMSAKTIGGINYGTAWGLVNGLSLGYKKNKSTSYLIRFVHYSNNDIAESNPPNNFISFGFEKNFAI